MTPAEERMAKPTIRAVLYTADGSRVGISDYLSERQKPLQNKPAQKNDVGLFLLTDNNGVLRSWQELSALPEFTSLNASLREAIRCCHESARRREAEKRLPQHRTGRAAMIL